MNLFKNPETSVARPKSRALIAKGWRSECAILEYRGPGIEQEFDLSDGDASCELKLEDRAPEGLSIWEGDFYFQQGYFEGYPAPGEGDIWAEGKFRPLTSDEWATLSAGRTLWPRSEGDPEPSYATHY